MKFIFTLSFIMVICFCRGEMQLVDWSEFLPEVVATIDGKPVARQDVAERFDILHDPEKDKDRIRNNTVFFITSTIMGKIATKVAAADGVIGNAEMAEQGLRKRNYFDAYPGYIDGRNKQAQKKGYIDYSDELKKKSQVIDRQNGIAVAIWAEKKNPQIPEIAEEEYQKRYQIIKILYPPCSDGTTPTLEMLRPFIKHALETEARLELVVEIVVKELPKHEIKYLIPIPDDQKHKMIPSK